MCIRDRGDRQVKVVILAGGFGTRISEESYLRPKPMIEIGEQPILWHIMKLYSHYGYHDFVICLGYKAYVIKEYFADYFLHTSDITFDLAKNEMTVHNSASEPWRVTLVDTGLNTMTGGRIKRIRKYVGDEPFMLTYGAVSYTHLLQNFAGQLRIKCRGGLVKTEDVRIHGKRPCDGNALLLPCLLYTSRCV